LGISQRKVETLQGWGCPLESEYIWNAERRRRDIHADDAIFWVRRYSTLICSYSEISNVLHRSWRPRFRCSVLCYPPEGRHGSL
jgi:hypothetical protein